MAGILYLLGPDSQCTQSRYAPTEGEALAVAWGLNNAKMFVLGCKDLSVI